MRNTKIWILFVVICAMSSLSAVWAADGYTIEELHSDITITPTGVYEVQEQIVMDFLEPLHGFYRVLPVQYDFIDENREDIRVRVSKIKASDTLSVTRGGDYISIRLGDANRTVRGINDYQIAYHYDIGPDANPDYDEFYYNIVGEDWQVPIKGFSFTIKFPKPVEQKDISFSRGFWGTTTAKGVSWTLSPDGLVLNGNTTVLQPGEAVTVRVQMPDGYFLERTDYQVFYRIGLVVTALLLIVLAWFIWNRYGRDKDLIIVPTNEPPYG